MEITGASKGRVVSVCISRAKHEKKSPVESARLEREHGLVGDAHSGPGHRQVSLLSAESIEKMRALGAVVGPGSFAENLTIEGIDLLSLPVGARIRIGPEAECEITQHGKECHTRCAVYRQAGTCVMPTEGIFGRVVQSGTVRPGDVVERIS